LFLDIHEDNRAGKHPYTAPPESNALLAPLSQHLASRSLNDMLLLLAISPVPLIWVLVLMLAAWQYMLYKYHKAHHDITEKVK